MIYFDNASTTKPIEEVLDIYKKVNQECWYNSSSLHYEGVKAHNLYQKASKIILDLLKTTNKKVVFTSGATEANNMAIYGVCDNYHHQHKRIITTKVEHPSVLNCFQTLEASFDVQYLDILSDGMVDLQQLETLLTSETILVSIMWVNNIIGSVNNINKIIEIVKKYPRVKLHVDAVQGLGKIPLTFDVNQIDLLTVSSHKIHGLKGTGILLYNNNLNLTNFTEGSGQQGIKSGTIDLAGIVATTKALQIAFANITKNYQIVQTIKTFLLEQLMKIPNLTINGFGENYSPYILNFSYKGINSETILHFLEEEEICVSVSSACNQKLQKPERTVLALTKDEELAKSSIRLSFSAENSLDECNILIKKLVELKKRFK